MALSPTPENFRGEIARQRLTRKDVCQHIGMNVNTLTMFTSGVRPLTSWAAHNIGWAINYETDKNLFAVNMDAGPMVPPRGRRRREDQPIFVRRAQRRRQTSESFY